MDDNGFNVSLSGHLFDQFLINEALDIIEAAGGCFHLVKCQVSQDTNSTSYSELEVTVRSLINKIVNTLTCNCTANSKEGHKSLSNEKTNMYSMKVGQVKDSCVKLGYRSKKKSTVLVLGAGRVCQPTVELLASIGSDSSPDRIRSCGVSEFEEQNCVEVIVASLFLKDAE
ncbi:hypothetical protein LXL04_028351 [Taraxacum kok-saghyz]